MVLLYQETLPTYVLKDCVPVYDRMEVMNCFNQHFISSGSFVSVKTPTDLPMYTLQSFNSDFVAEPLF